MSKEDAIDEAINSLDDILDFEQEEKVIISQAELTPVKNELDVTDVDSISEELVNMVKGDRTKADEIFDLFYVNLAQDKDRSTASKEALTKALELKIEASKNIIELLKIKAKVDEGGKLGLFFGTVPAKKAGFDMDEIREASKK